MSSMDGMPMPGGWTMSMTWMRMPGQTWLGAVTSFLGMWTVMMIAMMLPALVPMLSRFRQEVVLTNERQLGWLTLAAGWGYLCVWILLGTFVFSLGASGAAAEVEWPFVSRMVPFVAGVIVVMAGALQFSGWKADQLAFCRESLDRSRRQPATPASAWREGLRLGLHCVYCCASLTTILLVFGVMDLRVMAAVTAAITLERLAPAGEWIARAMGRIVVLTGLILMIRTLL
ncbi:MAG: DUF2182 domain-containing protein [Chthoniobacterales bacterium]